jgi:hypothetical protein
MRIRILPLLCLLSQISSAAAQDASEVKSELQLQENRIRELERIVELQGRALQELRNQIRTLTATPDRISLGEVASAEPIVPAVRPAPPTPVMPQRQESPEPGPLSIRFGSTYLTPFGFMDLTGVWRSNATGTGIATSFGAVPFGNTAGGKLSEFRLSTQNSRIGARVDTILKGTRVTGYWESDFLGYFPGNGAVTTNPSTFRMRLYWVDVRKGKWELLGGQSWSLITPGRKGISPVPSDLFYSQVVDTNYQLGLTWSRDPQIRVVYHASDTVAAAVSFENPEQYIGGSGGGATITIPASFVAPYQTQLNSGGTTLSVPNLHPDIVAKIAFDPKLKNGRGLHFELGGTGRTFRVWNPVAARSQTATGLGAQANLGVELVKGLYAVANNYWSSGGGRYIFGQAPDLIVRADGSLSPLKSGSSLTGLEYTKRSTLVYGYYGAVYVRRNTTLDPVSMKLAGYGYAGAPGTQSRALQEATFGFTQTFWKDPKFGALSLMGQYSCLNRRPWSGEQGPARASMVFFNLRYTLPGAVPPLR